MEIELRFDLAEGHPAFLERLFMEKSSDGSILVGVLKANGDAYVYSAISKSDFLKAVALLTGD